MAKFNFSRGSDTILLKKARYKNKKEENPGNSSSSGPQTEPQQTQEVWFPSLGSKPHGFDIRGLQEWLGGCPRKGIPLSLSPGGLNQ